ncbi:MAG: hypothetical protein PHU93_03415 [Candidatus Gracilibacteria bacterium]|nr:hypothetical protein [Candidatus Gracilibacteria bacterium]
MFIEIASAAGPDLVNSSYELSDVVRIAIALVVLVSGFMAVLFIIWGGVMLILSGGKDEKVKPAVNSIRFAVLGIIVIIIALFVTPKIGDMLGLNVSKYVDPKEIFSTIQSLSGKFFGSTSGIELGTNNSPVIDDSFDRF